MNTPATPEVEYQLWLDTITNRVWAVELRGDELTGALGPLSDPERLAELLSAADYRTRDSWPKDHPLLTHPAIHISGAHLTTSRTITIRVEPASQE